MRREWLSSQVNRKQCCTDGEASLIYDETNCNRRQAGGNIASDVENGIGLRAVISRHMKPGQFQATKLSEPLTKPANIAVPTSAIAFEDSTARAIPAMERTVAVKPIRQIVRKEKRREANWMPVAARNMMQAMPPATSGPVTPRRRDKREGPSASTKEVAVLPGPNTTTPKRRWRRKHCFCGC